MFACVLTACLLVLDETQDCLQSWRNTHKDVKRRQRAAMANVKSPERKGHAAPCSKALDPFAQACCSILENHCGRNGIALTAHVHDA